MTTCLYFDDQRDDDGRKAFVTRTKPITKITNGWRQLQRHCKNRSLSSTGSLESKTSNLDQYVMLDDDDDDDDDDGGHGVGAGLNSPTNQFPVVERQDILFIPQWSKTMVESQSNTTKDICIISSSDDEFGEDTDSDESFAPTLTHRSTRDEKNGAFPNPPDNQSEAMTKFDPPPINTESIEDLCGVSFLRPGDNNRRKKYRPRAQKIVAEKVHVSDSETEEDSSMSSIPEGGVLNNRSGASSVEEENCNNNTHRRSIRFSDEVFGQSLATIHLIPWSEHEDPEWIPRPVRCRIEL